MVEQLISGKIENKIKPVLNTASEQQLLHIKNRIQSKAPTFLSAINPTFVESAQVALLINDLINNFKKGEVRKTFFANSHIEAIHGAIKIGRHSSKELNDNEEGKVLFYDSRKYFEPIFNPLKESIEDALVPGIHFCNQTEEIAEEDYTDIALLILSIDPDIGIDNALRASLKKASENKVIKALDLSLLRLDQIKTIGLPVLEQFDIVIWGEALSDFKFPFGAFSTRDTIYKPWNTLDNCLLHSSTYGGNGMVMSYVKTILIDSFSVFREVFYEKILKQIETSKNIKYKTATLYLNGYTNLLFRTSVPMNFKEVYGSHMISKHNEKPQKYLDCVGGSGCNVRGHNRTDVITDVLEQHEPTRDYFSALEEKLSKYTGLNNAFMGCSGASVVEIGIVMGLLANKGKKKVIVFNGNYAGKTLVAINGTVDDNSYFNPLYNEVEIINPYSGSARQDLQKALANNDVGLVWFEYIQGGGLLKIPSDLISLLMKLKEQYGFFVGVDEILHGVYRTGNFLSFDRDFIQPDIITFAKGLSNMTFPGSVVMVSDVVVAKAKEVNNDLVTFYNTIHKNQLGAHLAVHILNKAEEEEIAFNVKKQSKFIKSNTEGVLKNSKCFNNVEVFGLHIRFNLHMRKYPLKYFSYKKANNIITTVFYKKGNIITFFGRVLPPLNLSDAEAKEFVKGVEAIAKIPAWYYLWIGVKQYFLLKYFNLINKLQLARKYK